ncbi:MAG TPA: choice-of-anchor J domain-containing protein, partial [Flavobacteriaceae bacterium]|nr:choice-of-anchor J domain-containing protein [Flavobacteriaceae bacterium]
ATDWEIEYGISGFAQGTGTLVFDDSDGIPGETVSGLTSGTDYEFYVRSDCGGDFSDWVGPYAFSTLCDIVTAPFTQGFESTPENEVTTCWSIINGGGPDEWYVDDVGADAYDGTKVMYISWDSGPHDDYLITPKMSITAGSTDRFTFHSAGFSTTYTEIFNVLVSTTGTNVGDFTQIDGPISAPQSGWAEHIYDLSAYAGQDIYVAIQVTSTNQLHLYIDGVVLDALPSCPKPSALTANNVMATSASLGWTENGTATLWDFEIVNLTMGETPSGTPDATGVSNPYLAENLDPASDYEFYVRADCGGGDLSEWSQAFGFTTLCAPVIPDYFQNFDTYPPNCWEEASSGTPATGPSNFGSSSWVADEFLNTGSNMAVNVNLYFNNKEEWLISPEIDLSAGNHELNYMVATTDYANSGPIEGGMMGTDDEVQVLISEDGGTTWINLMTYNAANTPSNTGDAETIDLSAYTGIVKIAFWATEGTVDDGVDFDYDFFIDDFAVVFTSPDVNQGNCSQMQVSNNFENGYGMNEGGGFIVADDFIVSASTTNFSVESITGNFLVNGGVATMDVIFYTDNGGLPGTQIGTTIEDIVPTSQTVIGSAFGFDVYEVVLDLPTPVDFAGSGTQDDTTYWLQLVAVPNTTGNPVYWEVTTDNNIGNSAAFSAAAPIAWEHDATNPDAVFTIAGICTYVDCPAPIDLTATMTSSTSVDISWTEVGSATEWQIEYGPTGFTPGTGTVVADNDGTLGVSISGLTAGTVYDYYVISICSSGDSYATGPETFMTPVCDPSSQCDYTFTLTDTFGDGWNGAEMEVRQNGIAIATLMLADGLTADVSVPICDGIDFELYWSVPGAWDNEVGISITNPFGVPIYTLVPDSVTPPASLYTGNGSCTPPSCEQPLNLSVTGITSEGANLSWDIVAGATNGYIWYVFADGADPQTATPVDTGTTAAGVTTATADGLTPLTAYDFYVKADCDADGMSDLSGPISFDTEVAPPVCGGNFYDAGGPAGDYDNDANVTTVISPVTSGEAVTVTFTAFDVEAGWDVLYVYDGPDATYPLIDSGNPVTNGGFPAGGYYGTNIPGPFTSSDPSGALTFVFMSDPSFAFAGWEADVTCAVPPACPEPTDLMVTDIGEDSAQVTWAPGGSETEWEIEYGLTGFTPGTGTIISDTDAPGELISGLTSEMTYDVYVTAICGADISVQVGPVSFTTLAPGGCTFSNPGNNLENGSSNSGDLNRIVANDIMIPADESFSLETIVFNEFMTPGVTANTVDVYIYEDNAGLPGAVISTVTGVVPVSQTVLGNNFGYDVSEVVLDITPVTLDGQVGASTTYWIGLSVFTSDASNCFWENTTASIVGNGQAYDDGVIGYVLDPTLDGVYSFNGVCSELGVENHLFEGFTFYPNPVKRSLSLEANNQIQQVEVFNLLGQSVFKAQPNSMNPSLELGELQAGAYLMKVTINDVTGIYRLIKE